MTPAHSRHQKGISESITLQLPNALASYRSSKVRAIFRGALLLGLLCQPMFKRGDHALLNAAALREGIPERRIGTRKTKLRHHVPHLQSSRCHDALDLGKHNWCETLIDMDRRAARHDAPATGPSAEQPIRALKASFSAADAFFQADLRSWSGGDLEYITGHFAQSGRTVSAVYYRDTRDEAEQLRQSRLFDWLDRHGIERQGRDNFGQAWYVRERYGSNLVALGADAMLAACEGSELVLVAGDAKLIPGLEQLARMDVPVTLVSTRNVPDSIAPPPPLIELAETFIDVTKDDRFLLPERQAD